MIWPFFDVVWPSIERVGVTFSATTPEEESVVIVEADLFALGEDGKSLEEAADESALAMAEDGFQVSSRESITTPQGVPAIVFEVSAGNGVLSGLWLVSVQEERFLLTAAYFFTDEAAETAKPLAEYSFDTLLIR